MRNFASSSRCTGFSQKWLFNILPSIPLQHRLHTLIFSEYSRGMRWRGLGKIFFSGTRCILFESINMFEPAAHQLYWQPTHRLVLGSMRYPSMYIHIWRYIYIYIYIYIQILIIIIIIIIILFYFFLYIFFYRVCLFWFSWFVFGFLSPDKRHR